MKRKPSLTARGWRILNVVLIGLGFLLPSFRSCEGIPTSTAQQVAGAAQDANWLLVVILLMPALYAALSLSKALVNRPDRFWWRLAPLALFVLQVVNNVSGQIRAGFDTALSGFWIASIACVSSVVQEIVESIESKRTG